MKASSIMGVLSALTLFVFPIACHKHSDDVTVVTVAPPTQAVVGVTLVASVQDAKTLALIPGASVTLTGKDANLVVDGSGNSLFHSDSSGGYAGPITGSGGIYSIPLKPTTSTTYPLALKLVASASGYVANSQSISVPQAAVKTDGTGNLSLALGLSSVAAPPATVSVVTTPTTTNAAGATTAPVTATTPVVTATVNGVSTVLGSASMAIPTATTGYTDATKTTPLTGALNVSVVYQNNVTPESLATYPSLTTSVAADGTTLATPTQLNFGALVNATVTDSSGHAAHAFSNPLSITATVTGSTLIADGSRKVKAGDIIPVWSYDDTHGTWTPQRDANNQLVTVTLGTADANGNFPVTFPTSHLCFLGAGYAAPSNVFLGVITITGGQGLALAVTGTATGWNGWWGFSTSSTADPANFINDYSMVRSGLTGTLNVYVGAATGTPLKSFANLDFTKAATLSVSAEATAYLAAHATATATVHVSEVCSTNPAPPSDVNSTTVSAYSTGLPPVSASTNTSGVATLTGLQVGKAYTITTQSRRSGVTALTATYTVVSGTNTIPEQRFTISCSGATGL